MIIKSRQTEIDSEVNIKIENEDGTSHLLERKERIKYQTESALINFLNDLTVNNVYRLLSSEIHAFLALKLI